MNEGCIPTKALVRTAELIHLARRDNSHFGFNVEGVHIDFARIIARKDEVVADVVGRLTKSLEQTENIDLIRGEARFLDPHTLDVGGRRISAARIILTSGSRPANTEIPGAKDVGYVTSTSIMQLAELPQRLVVVGAGPIGMEFCQMFHRFGSKVTVILRGDRVLPREDPDIALALMRYLEGEGLDLVPKARILRFERPQNGDAPRAVVAEIDGRERRFPADQILLALGREPNMGELGLPGVGVRTSDEGWIDVDDALSTNVPGIFAAGDAIGHHAQSQLYTHVAVYEGGIAARNAVNGRTERVDFHAIPGAVFTEPEVARVGMTEMEAVSAGYEPLAATYPFAKVGRARAMGETDGLFKAIVDRTSGKILGCHIFGPSAAELVHIVAAVMWTGSRLPKPLLDAIFIHPTLAEGVQSVFEELVMRLPARMAH